MYSEDFPMDDVTGTSRSSIHGNDFHDGSENVDTSRNIVVEMADILQHTARSVYFFFASVVF